MAEVGVLGPVVFIDDDGRSVALGGEKPRAVLARLALHPGRVVGVAELIDAVWGDNAPETAINTLQVHVSSLRRALKPSGVLIERSSGGYRLNLSQGSVDLHRFEVAVSEGRAALRRSEPERAYCLLAGAHRLWRGRPFEGLNDVAFIESARPAIENVHASATVELVDCLIALERHDEAIVEAERLVAESPFNERAWAALMLGYYWAGRPTDALRAFQRARTTLVEEVGLEPGAELVALEQGILNHSLRPPTSTTPTAIGRPAKRCLPSNRELHGREQLVERVTQKLETGSRLVSLVGLGGVGKTSIAIVVGHRLSAAETPTWFVDLASVTDRAAASAAVAVAVAGGAGADVAAAVAAAGCPHAVIILDNLEQVVDAGSFVTSLLDTSEAIRLLVTSRRPMRIRGEKIESVPTLPVRGDDGEAGAAVELFRNRAEMVRPDLGDMPTDLIIEVCELVAAIPLGIELAALQLRALTLTSLCSRLRSSHSASLDARGTEDYPARQQSLRAVLDSTETMLGDAPRSVLHRLSVIDGAVTVNLIERAAGSEVGDVLEAIADLVEYGLAVREAESDRLRLPVPVRQHVLAAMPLDELRMIEDLVCAAVIDVVTDADGHWYGPDAETHRDRLSADAAAIDATIASLRDREAWFELAHLSLALAPYWLQRSRLADASATLDRLRTVDLPHDLSIRLRILAGTFASYVNRSDTATILDEALAAAAQFPPDRLIVNGWCCLGAFHANRYTDAEVLRCSEQAAAAAATSDDPILISLARDFAGYAASHLGHFETAIDLTMEAVADARRHGDLYSLVLLLASASETLLQLGRIDDAEALIAEAFDLARQVDLGIALPWVLLIVGATQIELDRPSAARGSLIEHLRFTNERYPDPLVTGDSLSHLAAVQAASGDDAGAARTWGASCSLYEDHHVDPGRRRSRSIQRRYEAARERVGDARFDALLLAGSIDPRGVVEGLLAPPESVRRSATLSD